MFGAFMKNFFWMSKPWDDSFLFFIHIAGLERKKHHPIYKY
jgi:hypothetical protein